MAKHEEDEIFVEGMKFPAGTLALTFGQRLVLVKIRKKFLRNFFV